MSKLIKISTDNQYLYFNNNFQADIVIDEYSEIGFLNCNFEKDKIAIETDINDFLEFTITRGADSIIIRTDVPIGEFNLENSDQLLNYITNNINRQFNCLSANINSVNQKFLGSRFRLDTSSGNKSIIRFDQSPLNEMEYIKNYEPDLIEFNNIEYTFYLGEYFYRLIDENRSGTIICKEIKFQQPVDETKLIESNDLSNGVTFMSVEVTRVIQASIGGRFGLWKNPYNDLYPVYGIDVDDSTTDYTLFWGSDPEITIPYTPTNKDLFIFRLNSNKLQLLLFNNANLNGVLIKETTDILDYALYPKIYISSQTNVDNFKLGQLRLAGFVSQSYEYDPALRSSNLMPANANITEDIIKEFIGYQYYGKVNFKIEMSEKLRDFLGFNNNILILNNADEVKFESSYEIQQYELSEAYIIEMLNIPINSFDGLADTQQRKNILYVFQNDRRTTENDVKFQAPEVQYLQLNNKNKLFLRNIQCRILDSTYNKVKARGNSNITFLIRKSSNNI